MATEARACARCGAEIPPERIEAIPDTMVCVKCAGEMGGSEFQVVAVPERTSKEGSLKKNYGGYTTRKIRKPFRPKDQQ
jgi:RNA polymerase-binding transcription factor DksA